MKKFELSDICMERILPGSGTLKAARKTLAGCMKFLLPGGAVWNMISNIHMVRIHEDAY